MCNVSNVDDVVDRKFVEDKKVSIKRSCTVTSSIFQLSNIAVGQPKQNGNSNENEFANIFPSLLFTSTPLQSADNIQGFLQPPSDYQEEPCCSRDYSSPSNGHKVFCPFCKNAFSINTIEEHAGLCLESKTKFFFEKHNESNDVGELLDITKSVSENNGNHDQNK